MPHYRIHGILDGYKGAKTGKTYHATRGALIEAPEGEFKNLAPGSYSLHKAPPTDQEAGDNNE